MEIFKSNFIKTSTASHQRRSVASTAKLRLLDNPAAVSPENQAKKLSEDGSVSLRFNKHLNTAKDAFTQQPIQPMMVRVRNFIDAAKQQIIAQPDKTILAQANSSADVVASLLA